MILWALRDGSYLRSLYNESETHKLAPVDWCAITNNGNVLTYSKATYLITSYDLAGVVIARHEFIKQISAITLGPNGLYVIAGSERGEIFILRVRDLLDMTTDECGGFSVAPKLSTGIHYLYLTKEVLFIGGENGVLLVAGK